MTVDIPSIPWRGEGSRRLRLGLIRFQDIKPGAEPPYLVKNRIPRNGLTVAWGPPKGGKSFQVTDLAMAVARGVDYRGLKVQQGPVVYCAAEGATGFKARVEAYRRHHGIESEVPFYLMPDALDLIADAGDLVSSIRAELGEVKPVLVVLDTLNRSLSGSENDPGDMGAYVKACDVVREAFGCAVVVVHHCGTEGSRPRGHTSLTGAADAQLSVKRAVDGTIITTVEFMKDGPEGDTLHSALEVVTVGTDDDGEEITSCVMVEAEAPSAKTETGKLSPNQQTMLTMLQQSMPNGLTVEEWNAEAREIGLCGGRKQRLYDLRMQLKDKERVHEYGGRWFVSKL